MENWDATYWVVSPTPDAAYAITMAYIKQPDSITTSGLYNNLSEQQISGFTFVWFFVRSIWILERSTEFDTVLSAVVSAGFTIVCD